MRDVNAKAQAEAEAEADEKGSVRDRGSNDFINTFQKVTKRHTGLGDATPQKNGSNKYFKKILQKNAPKKCFKQMLQKNASKKEAAMTL